MIISIYTKKACDKIQHPTTIKTFSKLGIKWTLLNLIKAILNEHTVSIILMVNHRCQLSSLLFDIVR